MSNDIKLKVGYDISAVLGSILIFIHLQVHRTKNFNVIA